MSQAGAHRSVVKAREETSRDGQAQDSNAEGSGFVEGDAEAATNAAGAAAALSST
jgi:hypothetical protein